MIDVMKPVKDLMKKPGAVPIAVGVGLVLLFTTPILSMAFALIFAGVIPVVNLSIPAPLMFMLYIVAGVMIFRFAKHRELYPTSPSVKAAHRKANTKAKKHYDKKLKAISKKSPKKTTSAKRHTTKTTSSKSYSRA